MLEIYNYIFWPHRCVLSDLWVFSNFPGCFGFFYGAGVGLNPSKAHQTNFGVFHIYMKDTFCKTIGQSWPILSTAGSKIIYIYIVIDGYTGLPMLITQIFFLALPLTYTFFTTFLIFVNCKTKTFPRSLFIGTFGHIVYQIDLFRISNITFFASLFNSATDTATLCLGV